MATRSVSSKFKSVAEAPKFAKENESLCINIPLSTTGFFSDAPESPPPHPERTIAAHTAMEKNLRDMKFTYLS